MTPVVVLVGMSGAGKTTVGSLVARRRGVSFLDTDAVVERRAGKPVAEVFADEGEAVFRALEREAVAHALAAHDGVLALGGGAVLDPLSRARLAGHRVVLLEVSLADAAARIGFNRDRPLLLGNPRARLRQLMDERRPLYAQVATATVDTSGRSVEEVALAVEAAVEAAPP